MTYVLEVNNLEFGYMENKKVLNNVSFNIEKGEFVSIIGPNGCGKSTLINNLCNIYKPDNGKILLDGKNIREYKTKELSRKISLVPQNTYIPYDFSVFDVVLMGRYPYISRFQNEKENDLEIVNECLKLTNIFELRDRSINKISGGERQRVIIARTLAQESEIIFLDEPTSHLDINHQIEILSLLKDFNKNKGTTVVLVIHDINLALRYSDDIILMDKGKILSQGVPKNVITRENIKKAYNLNSIVEENPYTDSIYIVPLQLNKAEEKIRKKKIHVIAGGGTGGEILSKLEEANFDITLGVINIGDSDWKLAKRLSIKVIEEPPFNEIGEIAFEKNMKSIEESEIVILSDVPYGRGNLKNLQSAYEGLKMGKKVYLIQKSKGYKRMDWTEKEEGEKLLFQMKKDGLIILNSIEDFIKIPG